MKHVVPPGEFPGEPPFMAELRQIEARIAKQVDRYIIKNARRFIAVTFAAAIAGQLIGAGVLALMKWMGSQ